MLSRVSCTFMRNPAVYRATATRFAGLRSMSSSLEDVRTAEDARKVSGYADIDFSIDENASVLDAVQKFAAFNIGCLVTKDAEGNMSGIISERDYVCKIALLGRTSSDTKVKEIATGGSKLVTAKPEDSVEVCMEKMLTKDIRHLPIVNDAGELKGMISIKDLVRTVVREKEQTIKVLSDFALGKGGHFGSE